VLTAAGETESTQENIQDWLELDEGDPGFQLLSEEEIFKKAMLKRLRPILKENQIFMDHQFAFRRKHSTIEQVHRITEKIRGTLERNNTTLRRF
jgi:hypothetical protein